MILGKPICKICSGILPAGKFISTMDKVLFIANPLSVKRKGINLERLIENNLDHTIFGYRLLYTEYHNHALELAANYRKDYRIIVAAGGDGTVNQVSQALAGSDNILGLIPLGSGNGLARDLGIPLKPSRAIARLNNIKTRTIDSGLIGGKHFINMAGAGFDAEIAHDFAGSVKRGLTGYASSVIRKFFSYQPRDYKLSIDGLDIDINAFLISFANTGQYGNNAYISPDAKPDDGLMDICFLKKFPALAAPVLVARLFLKSINRSKYVEIFRAAKISLSCEHEIIGHVDGEALDFDREVIMEIKEKSLAVIV